MLGFAGCVAALCCALFAADTAAEDAATATLAGDAKAIVLLDATAGMALGRGESKFDLQKHALKAMPTASLANVRFATFGGKPCGGFADIGDARAAAAKFEAAVPAGRRNLAAALEDAAAAMPKSDSDQRIVAIVGGPNQCLSAVCARVDRLKEDRPSLRIDVIGFDLTDQEAERLHCVAANSGGRLLRADRNELATTLTLASGPAVRSGPTSPPELPEPELIQAEAPEPAKAYGMTGPEPTFPHGVRLMATLAEGGPSAPAGARFELLEHDSAGVLRLVARTSRMSAPLFSPPPGRYIARVVLGHAVAMAEVEAPAHGIATYRIPLNAGQVELAATMAGRPINTTVDFVIERLDSALGDIVQFKRSGRALATLPTGRYRVTAYLDEAESAGEVTVQAGAMAKLNLEAPVGFLRIDGVGEGELTRVLRFGREVARGVGDQHLFRLPTGAYRIEAGEARRRVVVAARRVAAVDVSQPGPTAAKPPLAHAAAVRRLVAERPAPASELGAP